MVSVYAMDAARDNLRKRVKQELGRLRQIKKIKVQDMVKVMCLLDVEWRLLIRNYKRPLHFLYQKSPLCKVLQEMTIKDIYDISKR